MSAIHETLAWPSVQGLTKGQIICLGRCGTPEQFWGMARAYFNGKCPFCDREHLVGDVLQEGEHWFLLQPPGTYDSNASKLEQKLVLVLKSGQRKGHGSKLDLPAQAWTEFGQFISKMQLGGLQGGMLYLQFGNSLFNAATVDEHPHLNIDAVSGNGEVRPPIYKDAAGWQKDLDRFMHFYSEYERGIPLEDYCRRFK